MMCGIASEVVDYLLFIDETKLTDRVRGASGFAERFSIDRAARPKGALTARARSESAPDEIPLQLFDLLAGFRRVATRREGPDLQAAVGSSLWTGTRRTLPVGAVAGRPSVDRRNPARHQEGPPAVFSECDQVNEINSGNPHRDHPVGYPAYAQVTFDRLRDRGPGIPTSLFGTYVEPGQLIVYPFFEYYRDNNLEYEPFELGHIDRTEFRGRYRASEGLIFVGYGISERLAVEFEIAGISASLQKSPFDSSTLPAKLEQSGLGDVEGQLRWLWRKETETRPELFSYFETVIPSQEVNSLIGTSEWEFKLGFGVIRGMRWGTVTARAAVGSSGGTVEPGEYAVEYLKRLSNRLRVFGGIEGSQDEVELITEAQVFFSRNIYMKLNNAFGLTSKAPDWAPEIGVVFKFDVR